MNRGQSSWHSRVHSYCMWWLTVHVEMVAMHASACINACVHSAIKDYEMTAYSRSAGGSGGGGGEGGLQQWSGRWR